MNMVFKAIKAKHLFLFSAIFLAVAPLWGDTISQIEDEKREDEALEDKRVDENRQEQKRLDDQYYQKQRDQKRQDNKRWDQEHSKHF